MSEQKANDRQVAGNHYAAAGADTGLQHWDIVALFNLDYFQGQVTKYIMRWRHKNGIEDLRKAQHFLQKYIEVEEGRLRRKPIPEIPIHTGLTQHVDPPEQGN